MKINKFLNSNYISDFFYGMITEWHKNSQVSEKIIEKYTGLRKLYVKLLYHNYTLWHLEDKARVRKVSDALIADVKRKIDVQNQSRNDTFENIDCYITKSLKNVKLKKNSYFNTETPGAAIDRLCILNLKIYHMTEETERKDVDSSHLKKCKEKLQVLLIQKNVLIEAINTLIEKNYNGEIKSVVYRQMKMYNDPSLNPEVYKTK